MSELIKEYYTLRSGVRIPKMGFGCYNPRRQDFVAVLRDAIEVGYRYFDSASFYFTECDIAKALKETGIAREEVQIASKAWHAELGYNEVRQAFSRTLENLEMDYVDFYLIHWPKQCINDEGWKERNRETWKALNELKQEGRIRHLGVSNFLPHHLLNLTGDDAMLPEVDQLESHIGYTQEAAHAFLESKNILQQGWAPLGRGVIAENPVIDKMMKKYEKAYGKTPVQFALRFLIQKGIMPIPKASTKEHMIANADVFDFQIEEEDMWLLTCMHQENWQCEHPDFKIPLPRQD